MTNSVNFGSWDINVLDTKTTTREYILRNLVGWGILAPSSHNVQPWRFRINPIANSIDVCLHKTGILKHSDPTGRQAHISIGCAIENILIAAAYYGLEVRIEYLDGNFYPLPLATLAFNQRAGGSNEKYRKVLDAIKNRRMNRGKFDPLQDIPVELISRMKTIVENKDLTFSVITDIPTRFIIAETQYLADRSVIAINDFRHELGEFLLPNNTEKGIGMPGNTFGLSDEMAKYVHEALNKSGPFDPDLAFGIATSGRDGLKSSPLIGIIGVPVDSPLWWIKAGMAFDELLLEGEMNGLSVAVHAAIVEVEMFNRLLKMRLKQNYRPTVIFRMGYAKEERPHSPRISAGELIEIVNQV